MQANAKPGTQSGPESLGRFEGAGDEWSAQWLLKRNCSIAPRQLLCVYLGLSVVSLAIASFFWLQGARLVMPFAWAEVLALGAALVVYARHACDRELIAIARGRLTVEWTVANHTERVEFAAAWVRVDPGRDERSLVELSGEGRCVAVGRHLRPALRRRLVVELRAALRQAGGAAPAPAESVADRFLD
ncbi:DUF2244 domain-containing protein [Caldimonas tepidiphila]|uniref:DUF2244 domain-containing protein n=1 Tax=Caldimonas tepidiphila TaxID=2315841 RepID=UPI000E5AF362|nr:DUF2244 domain-containing protein [Caldimonas tepidiphila]